MKNNSLEIRLKKRDLVFLLVALLALVGFSPVPPTHVCVAQPAIIPFKKNTRILQPAEQVIICFNGKKEIIVVRQYLKSTRYTNALRILPFPSQVTFKFVKASIFSRLKKVLKRKRLALKMPTEKKTGRKKGKRFQFFISDRYLARPKKMSVIEVDKIDKLDAHLSSRFFPQGEGLSTQHLTVEQKELFKNYIDHGFRHFYIDETSIRPKTRGIYPISYAFATEKLYYPLQLARYFFRSGEITIYLIYQRKSIEPGLVRLAGNGWTVSDSSELSRDELGEISQALENFFKRSGIKIVLMLFRGPLGSLSSDLVYKPGKTP